jgi:6-phosphogluconolactonase
MARLYAAVGSDLQQVEIVGGRLQPRPGWTVSAPAPIQYVWWHPREPVAYVACSRIFETPTTDEHDLVALSLVPGGGAPHILGPARRLASRPVHISTDHEGRHLLVACNHPAVFSVHPIAADGSIGEAGFQLSAPAVGLYPHQVRMMPSGRSIVLVTRGSSRTPGQPLVPGALKVFSFEHGTVTPVQSVTPHRGEGFNPRHVDFHPSGRWLYAAMEWQNEIQAFAIGEDDRLSSDPVFVASSLSTEGLPDPGQAAGAIHLSADGRFAYLSNRADRRKDVGGRAVLAGGENTIAVFAVDQATGKPTLIQNAPTRSVHVRTFAIDGSGTRLVAASVASMDVEADDRIATIPAKLTAFRISPDGRLHLDSETAVDTSAGPLFWCGFPPVD